MSELWAFEGLENGVATYRLDSWAGFYYLIEDKFANADATIPKEFVWRGQANPSWVLSPSLDRLLGKLRASARGWESDEDDDVLVKRHLERFKFAVRGRRGHNPPELKEENAWWALGQHYGLATPLLDWSRSPFAAAYFAFEQSSPESSEYHVIYGLDRTAVDLRNRALVEGLSLETGRPPLLEFYEPMSDENPRLVAQGGLFTRTPIGIPVQNWIAAHFEESPSPALTRILIPCRDRGTCLRALNRMNINHLSLFPDLNGASRFVNLALEDPSL